MNLLRWRVYLQRPLASGMFLCHFQILCGVPAECTDRAGTRPRHGATGPETRCLKKPVFLQQSGNLVVISSCDTSLEPFVGVHLHSRLSRVEIRGPPTRTPNCPDKDTHSLTMLSSARENFLSRTHTGVTRGPEGGFGALLIAFLLIIRFASPQGAQRAWREPGWALEAPWEGKGLHAWHSSSPSHIVCLFVLN